jgi:hypothetical protein
MDCSLDAIRPCLEGAIPGVMATCSADARERVAHEQADGGGIHGGLEAWCLTVP